MRLPVLLVSVCLTAVAAVGIPGTDPTGGNDSSAALNNYIRDLCVNTSAIWPRDVVVDLAGGVYRLDAPLAINASITGCTGVIRITGGTLLAGVGLGGHGNSSFLVTVLNYWGGLGVTLERIVFACNHVSGGVRVDAAHHVHILDSNFVNFATVGVWGSKLLGQGHDLVVSGCRLTECTLGMEECADAATKRATAILIEFPDSHFRNTVITCGLVGLVNRGGANTFHNLHIWPSCNKDAHGANLTVGFLEAGGKSRISDCYIDNSRLRVESYEGSTITNVYFNGQSRLELAVSRSASQGPINASSSECEYWRGAMCGMVITNNRFDCSGAVCAGIDVLYMPTVARQMYVHSNVFTNESATLCTLASDCNNATQCASLLHSPAQTGISCP